MDNNIGLKGAWRRNRKSPLRFRIKALAWSIRLAAQRAWYGYDSFDVSCLGDRLIERAAIVLPEFKRNNVGLWYDEENDRVLSKEETDAAIDKLIFLLEKCDEGHFLDYLYGDAWYKEMHTDWEQIEKDNVALAQHRKEAVDLLAKWIWQLWY